MRKFTRLLHYSLNMRKLFIHRLPFLISTYLPIWNRLGTGSILAIVFGILLAFSLIAIGYLFFSHRRGKPPRNTDAVTPFQNVEYEYLGPPTTSQGLQQPTPHTSTLPFNFSTRAANSKTVNEVTNVNVSHLLVSKKCWRDH
jgi:hypothetical protein